MKLFKVILSILIVIASVVIGRQFIADAIANQANKNDYAELNHIKYGLFSVDEWKRQLTAILSQEIKTLDLSGTDERELRKHIEVLLNTLIDKVYQNIRKENKGTAGGWVSQRFINIFINLDDIKKGIPEYADAVMHEIMKSKTKRQVRGLLNKQLDQYADQTFAVQNTARLKGILQKTGSPDIESARTGINRTILADNERIYSEAMALILLSGLLFAVSGYSRQPLATSEYMLLVLSLMILLIAGVTTPMIDMEAKISQMSFMLMGHPVHFENQVLYFQSKSILDVFWIMITHKDIQMKLVGVLLVTFSIVFPLLKILSTFGYYFNYHRARTNPLIRFFVLHSGKWSMADVMVVAIFMSYIGFNGIISNQFGQLRSAARDLAIVTTNGTSLQPGYYLFMTYTLLALVLSGFLTRKPPVKDGGDEK